MPLNTKSSAYPSREERHLQAEDALTPILRLRPRHSSSWLLPQHRRSQSQPVKNRNHKLRFAHSLVDRRFYNKDSPSSHPLFTRPSRNSQITTSTNTSSKEGNNHSNKSSTTKLTVPTVDPAVWCSTESNKHQVVFLGRGTGEHAAYLLDHSSKSGMTHVHWVMSNTREWCDLHQEGYAVQLPSSTRRSRGRGRDPSNKTSHTEKNDNYQPTMAPTKDGPTRTMHWDEIQSAVQSGKPVQEILDTLQQQQLEDGSSSSQTFTYLYNYIQKQQQPNSAKLENLEQVERLLYIYMHAEEATSAALALKQWSRFEISIESIAIPSGLVGGQRGRARLRIQGEVCLSSPQVPDPKILGTLPIQAVRATTTSETASSGDDYAMVYYTHGPSNVDRTSKGNTTVRTKYCVTHNEGLVEEKPDFYLHIYTNGPPNKNTTDTSASSHSGEQKLFLGKVKIPSTFFGFLGTQPPKEVYHLERDLTMADNGQDTDMPSPAAAIKVKFAFRKVPFTKDFLSTKRKLVHDKLTSIVSWIHRFNKEELTATTAAGNQLLTAHICAPNYNNVSLLHAAILLQNSDLVEQLLQLGANPYYRSSTTTIGSPMTLALNMSDRLCDITSATTKSAKARTMDVIIELLQRNYGAKSLWKAGHPSNTNETSSCYTSSSDENSNGETEMGNKENTQQT